jgi:HAD superfamily hydrolase (TIGR01493 family)
MSNISQELFTHLGTRDDGMDWNLFKESFVSGEAGLRKPDAAFYTLVLQRIGLPAENIFFVDDKANNVDAARALGIQGVVYTSMEKLEHAIRDFLG